MCVITVYLLCCDTNNIHLQSQRITPPYHHVPAAECYVHSDFIASHCVLSTSLLYAVMCCLLCCATVRFNSDPLYNVSAYRSQLLYMYDSTTLPTPLTCDQYHRVASSQPTTVTTLFMFDIIHHTNMLQHSLAATAVHLPPCHWTKDSQKRCHDHPSRQHLAAVSTSIPLSCLCHHVHSPRYRSCCMPLFSSRRRLRE